MNTLSAFTLTFIQLILVLSAIYMQRPDFTDVLLVYGSPIYLITHLGDISPFFYTDQASRMYLLTFQTFKYFFLIRSFSQEHHSTHRFLACAMEVIYLVLSCFYVLH